MLIFEELGVGFVAGILSRAISAPLSLITVQLQAARDDETGESVTLICKRIYKESGLSGFWRGKLLPLLNYCVFSSSTKHSVVYS